MAYKKITLLVSLTMTMVLGLCEAFEFHEKELGSEESLRALYERWCNHHKISREVDEKEKRFNVFKEKAKNVHIVNQMDKPYKLGLNKFSDMTYHEFQNLFIGSKNNNRRMLLELMAASNNTSFMYAKVDKVPKSVDWKNKGAVGPVKTEGQCGSSWAFSATGAVEGINQIKTGKLVSLSEQEIIDCNDKRYGCSGGLKAEAFKYIKEHGITTDDHYPYTATDDEKCKNNTSMNSSKVSIQGYEAVPQNDEGALLKAVAHQPVSVAIYASSNLQDYTGGVLSDPLCNMQTPNLATLVVGYGTDETGTDYWLLKNAWGEDWGADGYFRLARGITDDDKGMCGIATSALYPIMNSNVDVSATVDDRD